VVQQLSISYVSVRIEPAADGSVQDFSGPDWP